MTNKALLQVNPDKIVRRRLSDLVLEKLQKLIETKELKPGDYLPSERELMQRFGVGRMAIREALQSLHNSGLITISHGERSRVNEIDAGLILSRSDDIARLVLNSAPSNLEHLKESREMFELGVVRVAAQKATPEDVKRLHAALDEQRTTLDNPEDFIKADIKFHTEIAKISGNPIFSAVANSMLGWLFEHHENLLHWSGKEPITIAEHEQIINFIAMNDPNGAQTAMEKHLDRATAAFVVKT